MAGVAAPWPSRWYYIRSSPTGYYLPIRIGWGGKGAAFPGAVVPPGHSPPNSPKTTVPGCGKAHRQASDLFNPLEQEPSMARYPVAILATSLQITVPGSCSDPPDRAFNATSAGHFIHENKMTIPGRHLHFRCIETGALSNSSSPRSTTRSIFQR